MRVSRDQAAEHRERIVDSAAALFREHGFDGVGIDAIMKAAGLTHGGFYGHFGSKDDLAAAALQRALERSAERSGRFTTLDEVVADYLSARHCADRANGCPLAALGGDLARQSGGVRRGLTAHLRGQIERLARRFKDRTTARRRKHAIATLAAMVGALTLARAVDDPDLATEILVAAREALAAKSTRTP